jgi:WD40 repeat protein
VLQTENWPRGDKRRVFLETARRSDMSSREREANLLASRILRDHREDPERGILLAVAALNRYGWTPRLEFALTQSLNASKLRVHLASNSRVRRAEFSQDGSRLITAESDGVARIWNAASGELLQTLRGHLGALNVASYGPGGILTASDDSTARIWDTSGDSFKVLTGHLDAIGDAAFDSLGDRVVTVSRDASVRLWDAREGRELARVDGIDAEHAEFSRDGASVLAVLRGGSALRWDLESGRRVVLLPNDRSVLRMAFSPDGTQLMTGSFDGVIRVLSTANGSLIREYRGPEGPVTAFHHIERGDRLLVAFFDGTVRVRASSVLPTNSAAIAESRSSSVPRESQLSARQTRAPEFSETVSTHRPSGSNTASLAGHWGPRKTACSRSDPIDQTRVVPSKKAAQNL